MKKIKEPIEKLTIRMSNVGKIIPTNAILIGSIIRINEKKLERVASKAAATRIFDCLVFFCFFFKKKIFSKKIKNIKKPF